MLVHVMALKHKGKPLWVIRNGYQIKSYRYLPPSDMQMSSCRPSEGNVSHVMCDTLEVNLYVHDATHPFSVTDEPNGTGNLCLAHDLIEFLVKIQKGSILNRKGDYFFLSLPERY